MTAPEISQPEAVRMWWRWRLDLAERFTAWCQEARRMNFDGGLTAEHQGHAADFLELRAEWRDHEQCADQLRAEGAELEVNPYLSLGSETRQ